jgi:NTP pyrophosphatase (non-canonical NTP hydrolase)
MGLDMRPEVRAFAQAMERKLTERDEEYGEAGWRSDDAANMIGRLREEMGEVQREQRKINPEGVMSELVDVANFAMMAWDLLRRPIGQEGPDED